jgi:hypothetical protein
MLAFRIKPCPARGLPSYKKRGESRCLFPSDQNKLASCRPFR